MIDLSPHQFAIVRDVLSTYLPGKDVRVFGSRVTGRAKPHSDLDLVLMDDAPDDLTRCHALHAFEESDLPFRVDLISWDEAPPKLRASIEQSSQRLFT